MKSPQIGLFNGGVISAGEQVFVSFKYISRDFFFKIPKDKPKIKSFVARVV
jgi:hypothetical protein